MPLFSDIPENPSEILFNFKVYAGLIFPTISLFCYHGPSRRSVSNYYNKYLLQSCSKENYSRLFNAGLSYLTTKLHVVTFCDISTFAGNRVCFGKHHCKNADLSE